MDSNPIAKLGQSIQFVAFCAHFAVAALLTEHSPYQLYTVLVILIAAGIKEFYFDARYENDPPQTFTDNLQDFLGYALGALAGSALHFYAPIVR